MSIPREPLFEGQILEHYHLMDDHLMDFFSPLEIIVFEELNSIGFYLDVFCIRPRGANYQVLLTSGMSTVPMQVPETILDPLPHRYAELMMVLPSNWPLSATMPSDMERDWPVTALKQLARLPFTEGVFVSAGNTVLHDHYFQPYHPSVPFVGSLLMRTITRPDVFRRLHSKHGPINIFSVFPLYKEELLFIEQNGHAAFYELLGKNDIVEVLDPGRPNLALA